jgi:hypothetical protein
VYHIIFIAMNSDPVLRSRPSSRYLNIQLPSKSTSDTDSSQPLKTKSNATALDKPQQSPFFYSILGKISNHVSSVFKAGDTLAFQCVGDDSNLLKGIVLELSMTHTPRCNDFVIYADIFIEDEPKEDAVEFLDVNCSRGCGDGLHGVLLSPQIHDHINWITLLLRQYLRETDHQYLWTAENDDHLHLSQRVVNLRHAVDLFSNMLSLWQANYPHAKFMES